MTLFQMAATFVPLIALFGYLNHRFLKLPDTLGIMATGLLASVVLLFASKPYPELTQWAAHLIDKVDFSEVVFHGMLGMLLFAGSLHVNVAKMSRHKLSIFALATLGVLVSMFAVGYATWAVFNLLGFGVQLVHCLLFGALIAPTDPIAVLGVLKRAGVPESLETTITGESLFNDGTAVVAFMATLAVATGASAPNLGSVALLLGQEVVGAIIVGLGCGVLAYWLLRGMDSYPVEILVTLALPTGGYALAEAMHVSAPLAVVVMGLVMGNHGVQTAMSEKTREHLFSFWDLMDEILNLVLFGLMGLLLLSLELSQPVVIAGLVAIPLVLLGRAVSVVLPLAAVRPFAEPIPHAVKVMTWGGLRGGISIALALSLPAFEGRELIIVATYGAVVFSLLVQATTLPRVLRCFKVGQS